jgi:hypothetical protein
MTGFVLDHPVLHIMGWTGADMAFYFLFLAIWGSTMTTTRNTTYADDYYDGGRNDDNRMWHAVPLGLVISFGLFSLRFFSSKRADHTLWHIQDVSGPDGMPECIFALKSRPKDIIQQDEEQQ